MIRLTSIAAVGLLFVVAAPAVAQSAFDAPPISDADLKALAGREDVNQTAQSNSNATVSRNSIGANSVTGNARVDGQAFQNVSGLSIVNINTGNNVAINAAMNVNISITPGK